MEMFFFGRFHARQGEEEAVARAMRDVLGPTRAEPGCLFIQAYRALHDPRLFYIHSSWIDEAAFDNHAELQHTQRFVEVVASLIDHPLDLTRTRPLE